MNTIELKQICDNAYRAAGYEFEESWLDLVTYHRKPHLIGKYRYTTTVPGDPEKLSNKQTSELKDRADNFNRELIRNHVLIARYVMPHPTIPTFRDAPYYKLEVFVDLPK